MIKLTVYGSSSKGNAYLLSTSTVNILLDCGVKNLVDKVDLSKVDGVILSHMHIDHIGGIPKIKDYYKGNYYGNKDTLDVLPIIDVYKKEVSEGNKFNIKDLSIIPFSLIHDVPIFGYLIKDNISGYKLVYITDTGMIDNLNFKDIDCYICESNCDEDTMNYEDPKSIRVYETHLSMQQTARFLYGNTNHNTKHCILAHISDSEEDYLKHERYVKEYLDNEKIKVIAINPKIEEALEIILKEDIGGFDFE